ncbi:MAG: hypothetical protein ACOYMN_02865 [Roseimicrobium sp.]
MTRCLHSLLCILTALQLTGGHWGLLQVAAWADMIHSYTEQRGLIVGLAETFDGDHPCAMCKQIAQGREQEEQKKLPVSHSAQENLAKWFGIAAKLELPNLHEHEGTHLAYKPSPDRHPEHREVQPPVPPPEQVA